MKQTTSPALGLAITAPSGSGLLVEVPVASVLPVGEAYQVHGGGVGAAAAAWAPSAAPTTSTTPSVALRAVNLMRMGFLSAEVRLRPPRTVSAVRAEPRTSLSR